MTFAITRHPGPSQSAAERELAAAGIVLPLPQCAEFAAALGEPNTILFVLRDPAGAPLCGVGVRLVPTRALPGHHVYRVERLGVSAIPGATAALLTALRDAARADARCLRVVVEMFDAHTDRRAALREHFRREGFEPRNPRSYVRTLAIDLAPDDAAQLAALKSNTRRNVAQPTRAGLIVQRITDAALAPRVAALEAETFRRRGVDPPATPWAGVIRFSAAHPSRSHVVGIVDPAAETHAQLLACAWGCMHGLYATYESGASTRVHSHGRLPLAYALVWDLVVWARAAGAGWFDFGGVTDGTVNTGADPVGGISDFKRAFTSNVIDVGEEWGFEPHPAKAAIARTVSAVAQRFRS